MEQIKFIPKGVSNFRELREKNRYYVDKTMFLPKLERVGDFLFLTRPRRFGKSLFLSMMKDYYDINNKENFQKEFEGLYIANNPTELQGYFQVLYFDFAMLGGGTGDLEKKFDEYCKKRIQNFLKYYSSYYPRGFAKEVAEIDTLSVQIDYIAETARNSGYHLYLIIDEYDNFTNNMLYGNSESKDRFSKTTHGEGFYRQVFQSFKPSFERIIMFGVLPITLMDLTSCFNISTNISFLKNYNTMLGFSEKDVKDIIRYYRKAKLIKMKEKDILADLKPWYDGYCFSMDSLKQGQGMYNPNNVLSYLNILIETGNPPASLIDPNTAIDFNKLRKMVEIDSKNNDNSIINNIVSNGYTTDELFEEFDADKIEKKEYLPSLMYYHGMLTIGEVDDDELKLVIPNRNVRLQYYDYLLKMQQDEYDLDIEWLKKSLRSAANDGEWRQLMEFLAKNYKEGTSVRDAVAGEKGIQLYMTAYLTLSRLFITKTEKEMNHGFCDIFLLGDTINFSKVKHSYIIELKYLKTNATKSEAEKQWKEAVKQISKYGEDEKIRQITSATTLHLIVLQMKGAELLKMEEVKSFAATAK